MRRIQESLLPSLFNNKGGRRRRARIVTEKTFNPTAAAAAFTADAVLFATAARAHVPSLIGSILAPPAPAPPVSRLPVRPRGGAAGGGASRSSRAPPRASREFENDNVSGGSPRVAVASTPKLPLARASKRPAPRAVAGPGTAWRAARGEAFEELRRVKVHRAHRVAVRRVPLEHVPPGDAYGGVGTAQREERAEPKDRLRSIRRVAARSFETNPSASIARRPRLAGVTLSKRLARFVPVGPASLRQQCGVRYTACNITRSFPDLSAPPVQRLGAAVDRGQVGKSSASAWSSRCLSDGTVLFPVVDNPSTAALAYAMKCLTPA